MKEKLIFTAYQKEIERTSSKKIGLLCPYTVEELIDAAGFTPVRLIPHEPNMRYADAYLPGTLCSYLRYVVDLSIAGELKGFRGLVINHSCDGARRTLDIFNTYMPDISTFFVDTPKKIDPYAVSYFKKELEKLKVYLQEISGVEITDLALAASIARYNENRRLLQEMYDMRANNPGAMNAQELLRVLDLNSTGPKQTTNKMLSDLLSARGPEKNGKRVFVSGNIFDTLPLLEYIEGCGGAVVGDDFCFGGRYFPVAVAENEAPLDALARRYLSRVPCGRMINFSERIDYIIEAAQKTMSAGVIYTSLKFCDNFLVDFPLFRERLDRLDIPSLFLESEYFSLRSGQVRTRVEAFLERL